MMPAPERWDGSQAQIERVLAETDLAELFFFTKSRDWAYEQELRLIAYHEAADRCMEGPDGHNIYLFKFPPDCLKEIIFGIRMQNELKRQIGEVLKK